MKVEKSSAKADVRESYSLEAGRVPFLRKIKRSSNAY